MIPGNLERFPDLHPAFDSQSAAVEANRCLFCFDAPCTAACPTHIDVPRFIKKIATGNLRGSAQTILDANILGLSCSRVCPVDVLCEGACVMHRYNKQPIEIGRLQRYAMENAKGVVLAPRAAAGASFRVACIGGGPASLSCAAELRRHGAGVTDLRQSPAARRTQYLWRRRVQTPPRRQPARSGNGARHGRGIPPGGNRHRRLLSNNWSASSTPSSSASASAPWSASASPATISPA